MSYFLRREEKKSRFKIPIRGCATRLDITICNVVNSETRIATQLYTVYTEKFDWQIQYAGTVKPDYDVRVLKP